MKHRYLCRASQLTCAYRIRRTAHGTVVSAEVRVGWNRSSKHFLVLSECNKGPRTGVMAPSTLY